MISFNHIGNLGRIANQMFQYASLKGIARNRGYEFCVPPEEVFGKKDPLVKEDIFNIYRICVQNQAARNSLHRIWDLPPDPADRAEAVSGTARSDPTFHTCRGPG